MIILCIISLELYFFYSSSDNPPSIPVFTGKEQRRSPMSDLSIAVAQMAKAVTSSHSLGTTSCQAENDQSSRISPIKLANLCSNYLQQMSRRSA